MTPVEQGKPDDQLQAATNRRLQAVTPIYIWGRGTPVQLGGGASAVGESVARLPYRLRIKETRRASAERKSALCKAMRLSRQFPNVIAFEPKAKGRNAAIQSFAGARRKSWQTANDADRKQRDKSAAASYSPEPGRRRK